ncbi:branched-chain amino acid transport system ATP-binding protein [Halogranum amylolyticum]|uniref:Branched-chain amino acid transport system ATP-binding protein n=1 Tax=Halogranum amylolyticum TaxID=660520 RepID=A0A1H8UB52_9EURY|nr:ABC transporter ATP-binding protein [Halogranum amylolyticum]SEP00459.1 branched-chain amino acid transport system ATP-binding protein [Halogranum amylolyticum]
MSRPILKVDSVDTHYGPSHILYDVSLEVNEGDVVALVGRNGAGKTTTLRSIMSLTPPTNGTVRFRDSEMQGLTPHEVRRKGVSWVPEDRRVFPNLTVEENIALAANVEETKFHDDVFDRFPRLDERREQLAGTMSGGEQQMLAIARAMVGPTPDLLMLDEPSEGLAPQIVDDVMDTVRELNEDGTTILLVEQNAEMALDIADYAYVLETGRIVHESPAAELLAEREIMESYLGVH